MQTADVGNLNTIDELLEAQQEQIWETKTAKEPSYRETPQFCEFYGQQDLVNFS